ncbi:MAG TPA: hypothetical protein VFV34_29295 [Blastocatellia bacterium]|nr:hypothetical protein [Blastocatellia bacterium]
MPVPPSQFDIDSARKPIQFRPVALRRYQNRSESQATLKIDSSRRVAMLWPGLLLLLASGVAVWSRAVPVYVSADAVRAGIVVTSQPVDSREPGAKLPLLLFVRPEKLSCFSPGKRVVLIASQLRVSATVVAIEPPTVSLAALREKFGVTREAAPADPRAIVVIHPETDAGALDPGEIRVEAGERRLVAMLPLVGRIFE